MDLTPPPDIDLKESQQGQLYAVYSVTYALAVAAVGLRFLCRLSVKRTALWWDDYMSLLALVRKNFHVPRPPAPGPLSLVEFLASMLI